MEYKAHLTAGAAAGSTVVAISLLAGHAIPPLTLGLIQIPTLVLFVLLGMIAGDLPDLDEPQSVAANLPRKMISSLNDLLGINRRSLLGKVLYKVGEILSFPTYLLATLIKRNLGHRTLTHSPIFLLIGSILLVLVGNWLWQWPYFGWIFAAGVGSHLFLDFCTTRGLPLFYPLPFFVRIAALPKADNSRLNESTSKMMQWLVLADLLFIWGWPWLQSWWPILSENWHFV